MIPLTTLAAGTRAAIASFSSNNDFTERLQEMGLTRGTEFTLVRKAPFNGPIELSFGTIRLAVRSMHSDSIMVIPLP